MSKQYLLDSPGVLEGLERRAQGGHGWGMGEQGQRCRAAAVGSERRSEPLALPPRRSVLGQVNPRGPGQQGYEGKCVEPARQPFTASSRIPASHGGARGAAEHGPYSWSQDLACG